VTQRESWPPHSWGFLDHTQQGATVGRTPLDEWPALRRDLYLTTDNTHTRQTSMPLVGFKPTISAGERPQTYALERAATETGYRYIVCKIFSISINFTECGIWFYASTVLSTYVQKQSIASAPRQPIF
jgi:hypothetical protein